MAANTILHFFLLVIVGGFLYLLFAYITDIFGLIQNIFLNSYAGVITEQTVQATNFVIGIIVASPILVLLAIVIWAIVKGGSTSSG